MRISLFGLSPARMPSSLSWKYTRRSVRFVPSCRMPAPFAFDHRAAAELDVLDRRVVPGDDPDRLALRALPGSVDLRAPADALQGEAARRPATDVTGVAPCRVDRDRVPSARLRDRGAGRGVRLPR